LRNLRIIVIASLAMCDAAVDNKSRRVVFIRHSAPSVEASQRLSPVRCLSSCLSRTDNKPLKNKVTWKLEKVDRDCKTYAMHYRCKTFYAIFILVTFL